METAERTQASDLSRRILAQVHRRVVGQDHMVERLLIGLLTGGHVLFEGVPGLAKTLTVRTLAETIDASFQRIQFTPDLLPADVVGTVIYNAATGAFVPHRGPIFAHIVLADEINRAPAKVQAALLEAMQERQVTVGGETYRLPDPFLVLATQNPIEQEGTYPLPEAQVDRFMLKVVVGYPSRSEEKEILRLASQAPAEVERVAGPEEILAARAEIGRVYLDEKVGDYILDLVGATRDPAAMGWDDLAPLIEYGASPRASIALGQWGGEGGSAPGRTPGCAAATTWSPRM
jgi:MoxR-like ATPase